MKSAAIIFSFGAAALAVAGNPASYCAAAIYGLAAADCWWFEWKYRKCR